MSRVGRVVAASAVAVVLLAAPWWGPPVLRPFGFFAVRRVEVVGTRYLSPAAVVAALGLEPRASVWSDTRALERRLAALPGVRSVEVTRRLPSALVVKVEEVEPVALAEGPAGLVPVDDSGRPLPYDPAETPVDAPVVPRAQPRLVEALATIRGADYGLYADIAAARLAGGSGGADLVLELDDGRVRLSAPLEPAVVRAVAAVRRDLEARSQRWTELDGRYRGWIVVRRPAVAGRAVSRVGAARRSGGAA
jgi:hypothetical protein